MIALAAADRHHRVDRLQARLHRLADALARDHAGSDLLDRRGQLGVDRALAVDRRAERVDDASLQLGADRHLEDATGRLDGVALGDVLVLAQDDGADRVALEVEREAEGRLAVGGRRKLEHLALHRLGEAVDTADAVGHRDDGALVADVGRDGEPFDSALDQLGDFGGVQLHVGLRSAVFAGWVDSDRFDAVATVRSVRR
jgi:hypothetical protein